jgi:hypothetical protein
MTATPVLPENQMIAKVIKSKKNSHTSRYACATSPCKARDPGIKPESSDRILRLSEDDGSTSTKAQKSLAKSLEIKQHNEKQPSMG